jgi:magnesium-protoporphyrin IX monomethyl ester (oxidative) cyclase
LEAMQRANVDLADAKKNGKLFKRIGATIRAGAAFVNLLTIPSVKHQVPASTRMEPAY